MPTAVGIDFGTTNSAVALVDDVGAPRLAQFERPFRPEQYSSGRSSTSNPNRFVALNLCLPARRGPALPSGAEQRTFSPVAEGVSRRCQLYGHHIGGRPGRLPQLIALIVQRLLRAPRPTWDPLPARAVVGRPVHFTVARSDEHDALALARLASAGTRRHPRPVFEYEPIGRRLRVPAAARRACHGDDWRLRGRHQRLFAARARAAVGSTAGAGGPSSATTAWRSPATHSTARSSATRSHRSLAKVRTTSHRRTRCCRCRSGCIRSSNAGITCRS